MKDKVITYAQNREDLILAGFFGDIDNGFYVDVGANDPELDSVTKYFYKKGWHGINIEPIKRHHESLVELRPKDLNLNIGVSNTKGELELREYAGSGLSTFSKDMQNQYKTAKDNKYVQEYLDYKVPVETLRDIFASLEVKSIEFMKVDVEGYEYEVLEGNDWDKYRPKVICIEANHVNKDWHPLLTKNGYEVVFFDGLNQYLADQRLKNPPVLDYVESIISREPIINSKLLPTIKDIENRADRRINEEREKLLTRIHQLEAEVTHLERYTQDLLRQLDDIASLRKHARKVAVKHLRRIDHKIITKLDKSRDFIPEKTNFNPKNNIDQLLDIARQTDKLNAARYTNQSVPSRPLQIYTNQKRTAKKIIKKGFRA